MQRVSMSVVALVAMIAGVGEVCERAGAQSGETVGSVIEMHGPWQLADGTPLATGRRVPAGAKIVLAAGAKPDLGEKWYIHVSLDDSDARDCDDATACALPLVIPKGLATSTDSGVNEIFSKYVRLFVGAFVRGATRGPDLEDGVVALAGSRTSLLPIFKSPIPPAGSYQGRFRDIDPAHTAPGSDVFVPVVWENEAAPAVSTSGLKPGLYEFTLYDAEGEPDVDSVWIAFVDAARYDAASAAFAKIRSRADAFATHGDFEVARRFRRAGLAFVADPPSP